MAYDNFTDELKAQLNIVDIIGREVTLKKSGSNYMGLCPFHNEKTPSFSVNEGKQFYHCFGCGKSGDVIGFVQEYYKLPFMEAVEKLAAENGIKLPERRSSGPKIDYDKYHGINAKAARFFYNNLGTKGNKGLAYLKKRGLSKETITAFGLGYAPASGTALVDHLRSEGVSDDDMLKLGLANNGKNGLYDKFRDRVMFPIISTQDKVIGFGGRAIADIKPKYLNSPESEIFLKKNNLFGLNLTKKEIDREGRAIIVEGYMDMISLYQNGVKNVAASLGTALTVNQARLLCRYSKNIVLSYDSDSAGINAALRGIDVIIAAGGKPRVMHVTDGKDPDDFIRVHGKDAFIRLADNAMPATDYKLRLAKRGFDLSDDMDVLDYIERVVPILRELGPVELDIYARKLSEEFGVSESAIMMAVRTGGDNNRSVNTGPASPGMERAIRDSLRKKQDKGYYDRFEMAFAILAMHDPSYIKRFREDGIVFGSALANKIVLVEESLCPDGLSGGRGINKEKIFEALDPDEEAEFSKQLESIQTGPDDEAFYKETKAGYLSGKYRDEKAEVTNSIAVAEKMGRTDEIERLVQRLIELDNLINITMEESNA
ncbi:MAG: DNA primase [Mogibacterium sp.]|nr:DNA primase [Mogibacterium sp.]